MQDKERKRKHKEASKSKSKKHKHKKVRLTACLQTYVTCTWWVTLNNMLHMNAGQEEQTQKAQQQKAQKR